MTNRLCSVSGCSLAALVLGILAGCASSLGAPESSVLSTNDLLRAEVLTGGTDVAALDDVDVLAIDAEMRAFLDEHIDRHDGQLFKLRDLLQVIISDGSFGLEYDETTRTAAETFAARTGNCLSFTNMFVAMAREVGIRATYQEIEIPPDWSMQGDTYRLSRHVNVFIDSGAETREVDFNIDNFQGSFDRHPIPDERALAHYYSNLGAEYLQRNAPLEALRYFRKAVSSDREFAPAWSNLGALYSQEGHYEHARASYLQALRIDPQELAAMSNLGQLYEFQGEPELAYLYIKRSDRHRMRNPYYRYQLAHRAFLAADYDAAIGHLRYSLRKRKDEDSFYFLMGMSYLQEGKDSDARRWLQKAAQVARDDRRKRNYHSKLEMLLGEG